MSDIRTAVLAIIRQLGTPTVAEVSEQMPWLKRSQVQSCVWSLSTSGWLENAGRDRSSTLGRGECRYKARSQPVKSEQKRKPLPKISERTDRKGPAYASVWHYAQGVPHDTARRA